MTQTMPKPIPAMIALNVADAAPAIAKLVYQYFNSHELAGHRWPDDAEFGVVYCYSTWPCGWQQESSVQFFNNRQDLEVWIERQHEWMQLEDNYAAFRVYEWNLGVNYLEELSHNPANVRKTYRERYPLASF